MKYGKLINQEKALKVSGGTSLKERLVGFNYKQIVAAFGNPTFSKVSGDGKVQKEWVFIRESDKEVFTLYDWKTNDEDYTMTMNQNWNIGSRVYAGGFVTELRTHLKKKN
tara:strand:- start:933 stop:1262 length:330 start_codon:yes stop_codon:yes gene_type:complete